MTEPIACTAVFMEPPGFAGVLTVGAEHGDVDRPRRPGGALLLRARRRPAPGAAAVMTAEPLILVIPYGKRSIRLRVPRDTARWLWRQLGDALGEPKPKPRRQPRLRRGRWIARSTY